MANPLTLLMPVVPGTDPGAIAAVLAKYNPQINDSLTSVGTVHYARFLLLDTSAPNLRPGAGKGPFVLGVVTEYDGDFNAYIQDFVAKVGAIFDALLAFTVGGKDVTPVADHATAFIAYIQMNDASQHLPNQGLYQAYPQTVQQNSRQLRLSLAPMANPRIDYADVQGTILRGYRVDLARHFVLSVTDLAGARSFISHLVDGSGGVPRITTAARWTEKPECFLNIGLTCAGLAALGLTTAQLVTFDVAFQRGATCDVSAATVGDVGESAPANWIGGLADGSRVHVVLNLWVHKDPAVLEKVTARLRSAFAGCMMELSAHDAQALRDNFVHFGYHDNIAQPTVDGAPSRKLLIPDDQPVVPTGEFLLGYQNAYGSQYSVEPTPLSTNSSYAAFRILEQDVVGFEQFLTTLAPNVGIDPEMLAAKVCGRWRNGNPLKLMPDAPGTTLPMSQLNDFTYVTTDPLRDDTLGLRCPIGSHIRRNNPRNQAVLGTDSTHHRIVRRAMPYGPAYDPAHPDSTPRGLIGYFINGSLTNQFEFLQGQWDLTCTFVMSATGPAGSSAGNAVFNISGDDLFLGVNDPSDSSFTLAASGAKGKKNTHVTGFPRLITTRGGAYCFLPSIAGLRYLAARA